jgi:hypothetical protein
LAAYDRGIKASDSSNLLSPIQNSTLESSVFYSPMAAEKSFHRNWRTIDNQCLFIYSLVFYFKYRG